MSRGVFRVVGALILLSLAAPPPLQADPGGGLFKVFIMLVSKLKERQNAYRTADRWLQQEKEINEENAKALKDAKPHINVRDYSNRSLLLDRQEKDIRDLHQLLKKHAHDDFDRYVRSQAINLVFSNLSESASFRKKLDHFNEFITRGNNELKAVVEKVQKAENFFWPDGLKKAHDTVKASRKLLNTLDLIGASPAKLKEQLETLDTRLDKLKKGTEPKTLVQLRKELQSAQKEINAIAKNTATIVEKVSKTEALVMHVSKSALKDPKVKKLIEEISKREGEITAAYARQAFGPESMARLKELGIDPTRGDIQQVQKAYVQKLIKLKKAGSSLTPAVLDGLWLEAAKEVTPVEDYAKTVAVIKASRSKGVKPLEVAFSYAGKKSEGLQYKWEIEDKEASRAASFSYTFKEVGDYEVKLTVMNRRGVSDTAKKKITVTEPVTFSLKVTAEPKEVGRGGTVTVTATPTIKGVQQGKLDVTMSMGGKTFYTNSSGEGEIGYEETGKYLISKDEPYGKKIVLVKADLTLDEAMAKAYGKPKVAAQNEAVFEVKEGIYNSDLFIGTWNCIAEFVSHSAATMEEMSGIPKQSSFTLIITKKGNDFNVEIPGASRRLSSQMETKFHIESVHTEGNRMTIRAEDQDILSVEGRKQAYSSAYYTIELMVSDDGRKLSGTEEIHHYMSGSKDYDTQINKISGVRG